MLCGVHTPPSWISMKESAFVLYIHPSFVIVSSTLAICGMAQDNLSVAPIVSVVSVSDDRGSVVSRGASLMSGHAVKQGM